MLITKYDVIAMGNAIVDMIFTIKKEEIKNLKLQSGSMTLINEEEKDFFLKKFREEGIAQPHSCSFGGSAANTLHHLAGMGYRCALIGTVSDDEEGRAYLDDLKKTGIDFVGKIADAKDKIKSSGVCIVLVDEEGERTMLTYLGCASFFDEASMLQQNLPCRLFYLEGYAISSKKNWDLVKKFLKKQKDCLLSFSASDASCIHSFPKVFQQITNHFDLCFTNAIEAKSLLKNAKKDEPVEKLLSKFYDKNRIFVVTDGPKGSFVIREKHLHIPAHPTEVVDTTGAGDAYAAGIIGSLLKKGYLQKQNEKIINWPEDHQLLIMGNTASKLASGVISHHGSR